MRVGTDLSGVLRAVPVLPELFLTTAFRSPPFSQQEQHVDPVAIFADAGTREACGQGLLTTAEAFAEQRVVPASPVPRVCTVPGSTIREVMMAQLRSIDRQPTAGSFVLGRKLDSIPLRLYHMLVIGVLALVGFIEGYDLVIAGSCGAGQGAAASDRIRHPLARGWFYFHVVPWRVRVLGGIRPLEPQAGRADRGGKPKSTSIH